MTSDVAARLAFVAGSLHRRLRPSAGELTHVGLSALASIARVHSIRLGDLGRAEGMGAPATTRLIADLERQGLVARAPDPDDGRASLIRATDEGQAMLEEARRRRASTVDRLLAGCSADDLALIESAVGVLERALLDAGTVSQPVSPQPTH